MLWLFNHCVSRRFSHGYYFVLMGRCARILRRQNVMDPFAAPQDRLARLSRVFDPARRGLHAAGAHNPMTSLMFSSTY
jgi:hypothetical protein